MSKIFLKKVTITNLWGKFDLSWDLNENVNILIGKNGTGKSTVLDIIETVLFDRENLANKYLFNTVDIKFSNGTGVSIENSKRNLSNEYDKEEILELLDFLKSDILSKVSDVKNKIPKIDATPKIDVTPRKLEYPKIIKISTFDMELKDKESIQSYGDKKNIQTELDLILDDLLNQFKLFQLKLKNKVEEESNKIDTKITELSSSPSDETNGLLTLKKLLQEKEKKVKLIFEYKDKFINIINELFKDTNKIFNLDENNSIIFNCEESVIFPYQLSSGEKQILIILLTVILRENTSFILLMDEPEMSLHVEWQKDFLNSLVKLNPNMQIVLVTHSPALISAGWKDKVTKISNIISKA